TGGVTRRRRSRSRSRGHAPGHDRDLPCGWRTWTPPDGTWPVTDGPGQTELLGREPEQDRIARLLAGDGGGALVVCGPPGIGKSALLAWAERAASGRRVLRATGTVAELGLPYAGL